MITRKGGLKRLEMVAKKLDSVPHHQFNFARWVGADWKGNSDLSCGTTACALGWGTTIPALRKAGLRLIQNPYNGKGAEVRLAKDYPNGKPKEGEDFYLHTSLEAAQEIFCITREEAKFLFLPGYSHLSIVATAKGVADHIRAFIVSQS